MALTRSRAPATRLACLLVVCGCSGEDTPGTSDASSGTATLDGGSATAATTGSSASNDATSSAAATVTSNTYTGATSSTSAATTGATAAGGAASPSTSTTGETSSVSTSANADSSASTGAGGAAATLTTGQSAGGTDSGAGGSGMPTMDTWTNFAAGFFQTYCVMCHNEDNAGDASRDFTQLAVVVNEADSIACGVATAATRPTLECAPGAPSAEQFPNPAGGEPTAEERERLVAWIVAGMPE